MWPSGDAAYATLYPVFPLLCHCTWISRNHPRSSSRIPVINVWTSSWCEESWNWFRQFRVKFLHHSVPKGFWCLPQRSNLETDTRRPSGSFFYSPCEHYGAEPSLTPDFSWFMHSLSRVTDTPGNFSLLSCPSTAKFSACVYIVEYSRFRKLDGRRLPVLCERN